MTSTQAIYRFLTILGLAALAAGQPALAGSKSGSKTKTYGNSIMGIKDTASFKVSNSSTGPSFAEERASAQFSLLGVVNLPIADSRLNAYSSTGGTAKVILLGNTVWSKAIPVSPTAYIVSPDLTKSVFGSKPPKLKVGLGPFDVTLKGNAGVGAKQAFYHHVVKSSKDVEFDGYSRVWAFASGGISVSCLVAEIGLSLTQKFATVKVDAELDVSATKLGKWAKAYFGSNCLELVLWAEIFWIPVYEDTLVKHCTPATQYDLWP